MCSQQMDSEKFARTAQRFKEATLRLRNERRRTVFMDTPPAPSSSVSGAVFQKKVQCKARTLEGRSCQFFAAPGCSGFCKKHFSMM